ncbi:MAG TPA: tetratricopeptide repeat protein [Opitutaceae bacterium]|nr:tetratricopeptide repeat protein [Opitutaceae bacterium]
MTASRKFSVGMLAGLFAMTAALRAAPADEIQQKLQTGDYTAAIRQAESEVRAAPDNEDLNLLLVRGLLTIGRYADASSAVANGLSNIPQSIRLRWIGREASFANGRPEAAARMSDEIRQLVTSRSWAYRDPVNLVVFARVALLLGADPKDVLDKVLGTAQKGDPKLRDVYLAKGELAMDKHDFVLAAKAYQEGLKQFPDDPDFHYGLARAYESGDRTPMLAELEAATKVNPRHVPSLLLLADHKIASEDYDDAEKILDEIKAINPWQSEAWADRAVIAHLKNEPASEKVFRENGLHFWPANPLVDWAIGKKLAEKYRFAEGEAYQRRALQFDPNYLPAKAELASDLLRLGQETEGWQLAQQVHTKDDYDVEAYNLVTLHDTMAKYATLTNEDFVLRMTPHEADVYGPRVLDLLMRARAKLTAKYGIELARPTYVEVFGDQKDFAVRTFGMPDIPGFLGVCFGRVVTANGPAANAASPANWEAVLWHEFCHVITLQLTKNKMPRWLSEGISVYEESQADPSWGMRMTPHYHEIITSGKMTPVGSLSGAFLAPPTGEDLQFAYYESSLVVRFLVEHYGADKLRAILVDLGNGSEINEAIAAHTAPMAKIEEEFSAYAKAAADQLAPGLTWDKPKPDLLELGAEKDLTDWAGRHPDNYWALTMTAHDLMEAKKWPEAKAVLLRLVEAYPSQTGGESAYRLLAATHRALGETTQERSVLTRLADLDDDATESYLRLMELAKDAKDWPAVKHAAERFLAVNPLVVPPYRYLAEASAEVGDTSAAIAADRTLLKLDPPNPADAHFQLAQLLHRTHDPEAKRHVLEALEEAPRYREALALLLDIDRPPAAAPAPEAPPPAGDPAASK